MRKREEEESRSRRKRKWFTPRSQDLNDQDTKYDGAKVVSRQMESQQFMKNWRGDIITNRGKSERRGGEGVELPNYDAILERSQERSSKNNILKYGTSDNINTTVGLDDLAPGTPVADLWTEDIQKKVRVAGPDD